MPARTKQAGSSNNRIRVDLFKIYDSRGNPTVQATVSSGVYIQGTASCPSGASTGTHEVTAFPKGSVDLSMANARAKVLPRLSKLTLGDQKGFDGAMAELDGTPDFTFLGGNAATALSLAYARASARASGMGLFEYVARLAGTDGRHLPAIVGNVMNGGVHAVGGPDIQEFIAFVKGPDARSEVEAAVAVHREVGKALRAQFPGAALGKGDEGGWVAPLTSERALDVLAGACTTVTDRLRGQGISVKPGLDLAASELFKDGRYVYSDRKLTKEDQVDFVAGLVDRYDLAYIEDPFDEEDFDSFGELTRRVGRGRLVVGDDVYTTSPARVQRGISEGASNAVLLKVNQVGTLSTTLESVRLARQAGWDTITSHRSGETPDDWLSHLSVAFGSAGIKCGVLGGERVAKLNELVRIAEGDST